MTLLYRARDAREAALLIQALEANGIACTTSGGGAAGSFGGFVPDAVQVDLLVDEDRMADARRVIEEELARPRPQASAWTCAGCGSENEPGFDVCWKCQAPRA